MKTAKSAPVVMAACCTLGAGLCAVMAWNLGSFVRATAGPSVLSDPLQVTKLKMLGGFLALTAGLLMLTAWRVSRHDSPPRDVVATWSPIWVFCMAAFFGYLLLVYYPLPSHRHHLDKLLGLLSLMFLWAGWLNVRPVLLGRALNGRLFFWMKVGVVNLAIFLALGEAALRLADPALSRSGLFGDPRTPASLKPYQTVSGSIGHSNSLGFRDRERSEARPSSAPRVVALGDSFTWGAGVQYDDVFLTLAEAALQKMNSRTEIINLGVPGFEPEHYLHLLKSYGLRLHPDVVVVNFYIGNDLMRKRGADMEEVAIVAGRSHYVHRNGNWIHDRWGPDRSYLYHNLNFVYRMGRVKWHRWMGQAEEGFLNANVPTEEPVTPAWSRTYLQNIDDRSEIYLAKSSPMFETHWRHVQTTLGEMNRLLQSAGVLWILVLIPDEVQVDGRLREAFLRAIGAVPEAYDFEKPQDLLRAWCALQGVSVIDLLPSFRQAAATRRLYIHNDTHWNAAGHALAAAQITPLLQTHAAMNRSFLAGQSHSVARGGR